MHGSQKRFEWSALSAVDRIAIVTLAVASLVQVVGLLVLPVNSYDAQYHLFWITAWHKLWQAGIYYPRWLPDSFHGFGAPTFYYYPPLTYALTSLLYLVQPAADLQFIAKLFLVITLAGSGITMWWFLRSHISSATAIAFGVALYLFAPYRFLDSSIRATFTEHFAFVFLPVVFLSVEGLLAGRNSGKNVVILALSLALLTLTSVPSTVVAFTGLVVYALASRKSLIVRNLTALSLIAIVTILLCAFYLIVIPFHLSDIQFSGGTNASIGSGSPLTTLLEGGALRIGLYTLLTYLGGCYILYRWWNLRRSDSSAIPSAYFWLVLVIVLLELPWLPHPLFQYVPPFTAMQQAYRLSMILVLIMAWLWSRHLSGSSRSSGISYVVMVWSLGTIALVGAQLTGFKIHPHPDLRSFEPNEFPTRWMPTNDPPAALLPFGFESGTSSILLHQDANSSIFFDDRKLYSDSIVYRSAVPTFVTMRRAYWPSWDAYLDGAKVTPSADSLGRLIVPVPVGIHTLTVQFDETTPEWIGMWLSITTFLALVLFGFFYRRTNVSPEE